MPISDDPLQAALVEHEMSQAAPQSPPPPPVNPVVQRALERLGVQDNPGISVISRDPNKKYVKWLATEQAATVMTDPKRPIEMPDWTPTYQKAAKGDHNALVKTAAALAHEMYHQKNGPDEGPAYDEQIAALIRLGAPADMIKKAQQSKAYALSLPPQKK